MLSYQVIRSNKRKTVGLQVKHGKIIIRAPKYVAEQDIANIVAAKSAWLQRKVAEQNSHTPAVNNHYQDKSQILIYGQLNTLNVRFAVFPEVLHEESALNVTLSQRLKSKVTNSPILQDKQVKHQLDVWLKQETTSYINNKLSLYAEKMKVFPKSFKVRLYKSRWGSCNSRGELSFSSLLAMVPHWVIDYVIVHELCHLMHMNHSAEFWLCVEQHFPNYLLAKTWLKSHQSQLQWPSLPK